MTLLVVAAALVAPDRRVLLQRRPPGRPLAGLWEFPGGKVEDGERAPFALARELDEELGIGVDPARLQPLAFASEPLAERELLLLLFGCRAWTGKPEPRDGQSLAWVHPAHMDIHDMPPADRDFPAAIAAWLAADAALD